MLEELFEQNRIPLGDWAEAAVDWLDDNPVSSAIFDGIENGIDIVLTGMEGFLLSLPPLLVVLVVMIIGFLKAGGGHLLRLRGEDEEKDGNQVGDVILDVLKSGWKLGLGSALLLVLIGLLGYWELTMTTISIILTALFVCIVIGVPLGILAASSDTVENIIRPVLDAMQTIHPFVYLVPVVIFFGIGEPPGTLATIVFALPPIVRLTNLGIRQVPGDVVEAGKSFGSSDRQLLFDVKLPLALPTIMAGLNQTLMLALSMVVIVALIAGGGLGQAIFRAVNNNDIGTAVQSGLVVVLLAILLDRISQIGQRSTAV
jgi:glycine betaine/proline transport system permease protein